MVLNCRLKSYDGFRTFMRFYPILPDNPEVSIYFPFGLRQGLFRVAKPKAVVEPPNIGLIKEAISEAAAMIEGLIRHDTQMRVEKNFVDSHGQSEVAFAFCRLLNEFKLMPRLKRIKRERLYLPDRGMANQFQNLAGVLTRPIRWDIMNQQYDEMMKATVAMKYVRFAQ